MSRSTSQLPVHILAFSITSSILFATETIMENSSLASGCWLLTVAKSHVTSETYSNILALHSFRPRPVGCLWSGILCDDHQLALWKLQMAERACKQLPLSLTVQLPFMTEQLLAKYLGCSLKVNKLVATFFITLSIVLEVMLLNFKKSESKRKLCWVLLESPTPNSR